jgi:hypothetical protein
VREIEEKVKVRQIMIPLLQFETLIIFANAIAICSFYYKRKNQRKNLPIKTISPCSKKMFEEKQLTIIIHKKPTKNERKNLNGGVL